MVSRIKRSSYVTDSESSSDECVDYAASNKRMKLRTHKNDASKYSKVKQEYCEISKSQLNMGGLNRNAVMARENRKKKKMYIQNLEDEVTKLRNDNSKLSSILDNQSFVISELRKEIKYMKSVLANSSDIGNLIKNIKRSTGMSVTTSLDKTLTLNNDCVSKRKTIIPRKTAHPWENQFTEVNLNNSTAEESLLTSSSSNSNTDFDITNAFNDLDIPLDVDISIPEFQFDINSVDPLLSFDPVGEKNCQNDMYKCELQTTWSEHNYTNAIDEEDVGVCLHVSKHRVSLEFCPSCSENALQTWKEMD